jgi:hypothetical protein
MPQGGAVTFSTRDHDRRVLVEDTGTGSERCGALLRALFTTKAEQDRLGLSIATARDAPRR